MTVYLAGPIEGISIEEASRWRGTATNFFDIQGIETLDPLRRKKFHDEPYSINLARRIVTMDVQDIRNSHIVLINLLNRGEGKAWGSIAELIIAHYERKPVVVVMEADFKHPFIETYATEIHYDLNTALHATLAYYR